MTKIPKHSPFDLKAKTQQITIPPDRLLTACRSLEDDLEQKGYIDSFIIPDLKGRGFLARHFEICERIRQRHPSILSRPVYRVVDGKIYLFAPKSGVLDKAVQFKNEGEPCIDQLRLKLAMLLSLHMMQTILEDSVSGVPSNLALSDPYFPLNFYTLNRMLQTSEGERRVGYIHGLVPEFFVTRWGVVSITAVSRSFQVVCDLESPELVVPKSDGGLLGSFTHTDQRYNLCIRMRVDADKIPYFSHAIRGDNTPYKNSKVHALNVWTDWMNGLLERLRIPKEPVLFQPDDVFSDCFLQGSSIPLPGHVCLVNVTGKNGLNLKPITTKLLSLGIEKVSIFANGKDQSAMPPESFPFLEDTDHLFLQPTGASHCLGPKGSIYGLGLHEMEAFQKNHYDTVTIDFYSRLKLAHMSAFSGKAPTELQPVFQAMAWHNPEIANVKKAKGKKCKVCDDEGAIPSAVWTFHKPRALKRYEEEDGNDAGADDDQERTKLSQKTIDDDVFKTKLQSIINQLKVKSIVHRRLPFSMPDIPARSMTLIGTRQGLTGREYYAEMDLHVSDGYMQVVDIRHGGLNGKWRHIPQLKAGRRNPQLLHDRQFFLIDHEHKLVLQVLTDSKFVPSIIGNASRPLSEWIKNGGLVNKDSNRPFLPFYLGPNPKKKAKGDGEPTLIRHKDSIFSEDHSLKGYLSFFVPDAKNIRGTLATQSCIQHVMISNLDGSQWSGSDGFSSPSDMPLSLVDLPITRVFRQSFTFDLLRVNDNSRSTLLQKFIREVLGL